MTPLRQTMIQAMCQHGFSPRTQHSYLYVVTALKVKDIDGERYLLRIEQGKGAKDRMVPLAPGLLQALRRYWRIRHPMLWLFPSDLLPDRHLHITTPQKVYHTAKTTSGIEKCGGIHALRHAYATHQLERGLPIHELQRLLGHSDLRSTQRYLHWLPGPFRLLLRLPGPALSAMSGPGESAVEYTPTVTAVAGALLPSGVYADPHLERLGSAPSRRDLSLSVRRSLGHA